MAFTGLQYEPNYTDGTNNSKSTIDYKSNADQMNTFYWIRKALPGCTMKFSKADADTLIALLERENG